MKTKIWYSFLIQIFIASCGMASKNQDKEMKLTISHYKVPCSGESVQLCYLIKKPDGKTEFFHDEIEGFQYEWGYNYTIGVEKITRGTTMADASSFTYKLTKVYRKEKLPAEETFPLTLSYDDQRLVENKNGACSYFGAITIQTAKFSCEDLLKARSGIFKYAADKSGLVLVSFK